MTVLQKPDCASIRLVPLIEMSGGSFDANLFLSNVSEFVWVCVIGVKIYRFYMFETFQRLMCEQWTLNINALHRWAVKIVIVCYYFLIKLNNSWVHITRL